MFSKLFSDVDEEMKIVTFEHEPSAAALCSVLEAMLRSVSRNMPDCTILVMVDELTVTDAPVPASVRLSPLQPAKTYDVLLAVVVLWHGLLSTTPSRHPKIIKQLIACITISLWFDTACASITQARSAVVVRFILLVSPLRFFLLVFFLSEKS